jgi:hypothetical protein
MLTLIGLLLALGCCILQLAFWLRWRDRALLWWAAANGIGAAGGILLLSPQWLPPWIARSMANTTVFGSGFLLWLGFRCFGGQRLPLRAFAAVTLVYFAAFETLRALVDDLASLIMFSSFLHGLQEAGIAFDLARAQLVDRLRVRSVLLLVFVLHALFYLFRGVTAVTVEPDAVFLHTVGLQAATLLFILFNLALWNAAALWMVGERRRASAAAAEAAG